MTERHKMAVSKQIKIWMTERNFRVWVIPKPTNSFETIEPTPDIIACSERGNYVEIWVTDDTPKITNPPFRAIYAPDVETFISLILTGRTPSNEQGNLFG